MGPWSMGSLGEEEVVSLARGEGVYSVGRAEDSFSVGLVVPDEGL